MQKPLCVSIIAKSLSELNKNKIDHSQKKIAALLSPKKTWKNILAQI